MKKFIAMVLALVLVAGLSVAGTVAYLQDSQEVENTMTLGNVDIGVLEYERAVDANGEWIATNTVDKYGYTPDQLQKFTDKKPLYPAVFADGVIKWDDRNGSEAPSGAGSHQQSWAQVVNSKTENPASGSNQLFDSSVKNVIDKFVFVENTGKSDAYVRVYVALEQGSIDADNFEKVIMTNSNGTHWESEVAGTDVVINGSEYYIICYTYLGPASNPTGILAPGAVSYPSLLQVYMKPEATNEHCEAIDGNDNDVYDILVYAQAVQTAGFDNAEAALKAAFGNSHPWAN